MIKGSIGHVFWLAKQMAGFEEILWWRNLGWFEDAGMVERKGVLYQIGVDFGYGVYGKISIWICELAGVIYISPAEIRYFGG